MANFYDAMKNRLMELFSGARGKDAAIEQQQGQDSEMIRNTVPAPEPEPPEWAGPVIRQAHFQQVRADDRRARQHTPAPAQRPARTERQEFNISANRGRAEKDFERAARVEEFKERLRSQREEERGRDRGRDNSR